MSASHRVNCQEAYLLHTRPYRNTSQIIEVFSVEYGRVAMVVRGARMARSRWTSILLPFQRILVSWQGRGDLKTLTAAESDGAPCWLQGNELISGLYSNELLMRLLHRDDPHPQLLRHYEGLLHALSRSHDLMVGEMELSLRRFEMHLLQEIGYGLSLDMDARSGAPVKADHRYHFYLDEGPVLSAEPCTTLFTVAGTTLLALAEEGFLDKSGRREAKQLMRLALAQHLGQRPLYSRRLYVPQKQVNANFQ